MDGQDQNSFIKNIRGRGALENPSGRFERIATVTDAYEDGEERQIKTEVFKDASKTIISENDSPDLSMEASINPYRGCEHGCIYCYARPTHEYFGLSAGLDFESKIFAKENAAELLCQKLASKSWDPKTIVFSGVTDAYQPIERKMKITRSCLDVLLKFKNPTAIITKNHLVTRDIDILSQMAAIDTATVYISMTTLDREVARAMEPRASTPPLRLRAIEELARAGIPVGVSVAPVIPGLTDHEIPKILEAAANAGATSSFYSIVRLPYGVKDLFQTWAKERYPDRADKILNRIRDLRGGSLNDPNFGSRMQGGGVFAQQTAQVFALYKKKYGLDKGRKLSIAHFRRDAMDAQMSLL